MKRKVSIFYLLVIFLNLSEMYRPLGLVIGFDRSSVVTGLSLLVTILYLFIHGRELLDIIKFRLVFYWILLVLVIPTLMMILHFFSGYMNFEELFYWMFFSAHFGFLMLGVIVLVGQLDSRYFKFLYIACVFSVIFGFVVNLVNYDFIRQVLLFTGNKMVVQESLYRIMGFFQHPNLAALSVILYFVILMGFFPAKENSLLMKNVLVLMMIFLVVITGSRTSTLLAVVVMFMYLWPVVFNVVRHGAVLKLIFPVPQIIGWISVIASLLMLLPMLANVDFGIDALNRVMVRYSSIVDILSQSSAGDASLDFRMEIIPVYFEFILEKPFIGFGPQFVVDRLADGVFFHVSQNALIEWSLKYGVIYSFFFIYVLFATYSTACKLSVYNSRLSSGLKMFIILIVAVSFSINDLFWYRSVVVSIGVLLGYYCVLLKSAASKENIEQSSVS